MQAGVEIEAHGGGHCRTWSRFAPGQADRHSGSIDTATYSPMTPGGVECTYLTGALDTPAAWIMPRDRQPVSRDAASTRTSLTPLPGLVQ